jgi:hypothetical protein
MVAIGCPPSEYVLAKQVPGCNHNKTDYLWRYPLSWPGYAAMMTIFASQGITVYPELQAWADAKWHEVGVRLNDRAALEAADGDLRGWLMDMDARMPPPPAGQPPYAMSGPQRGGVQWLLDYRRVVLGDTRGNGKTPVLARALWRLKLEGEGLPALVICRGAAILPWQRKLALWAPELRVVLIQDSAAKRRSAIEKLRAGEADVGIIAWDNVRHHTRLAPYPSQAYVVCDAHGGSTGKSSVACEVCPKEFNYPRRNKSEPQSTWLKTVIPDEAHALADPKSKQSRAVWFLMHHTENTWPTTGTLTPNSVGDLWAIYHGLDPRGWPSRMRYTDLYALKEFAFMGKGEVILDLRPDTAATFHLVSDPLFRRIPREIARAGEPAMAEPEFRYPKLTPKQERVYAAITKAGLAELEPGELLVPGSTIVKYTRQCQLATAMLQVEDIEDPMGFSQQAVRYVLPSNKVTDVIEFLADEPGQWIIALNSPQVIPLVTPKLDKEHITWAQITGGMKRSDQDASGQQFQSGQARVIFITDAGGESIDLQAAEGIYWLQPDPTWRGREQKTGRGDRWGRTTPLRQVWCLSPGTVDIRHYQLGLIKEARADQITRDAKMLRWIMEVAPGEIVTGDDHDSRDRSPYPG